MPTPPDRRSRPEPPRKPQSHDRVTVTADFEGEALHALNWFLRRPGNEKRNQPDIVRGAVKTLYAIRTGTAQPGQQPGQAKGRSAFAVGLGCLLIGFIAGLVVSAYFGK
jgi:hypothetical protein